MYSPKLLTSPSERAGRQFARVVCMLTIIVIIHTRAGRKHEEVLAENLHLVLVCARVSNDQRTQPRFSLTVLHEHNRSGLRAVCRGEHEAVADDPNQEVHAAA